MKKKYYLLLFLCAYHVASNAQIFIPEPKNIQYTSDKFSLNQEITIDNSVLKNVQKVQLKEILDHNKFSISNRNAKNKLEFKKISPLKIDIKRFQFLGISVPESFGEEGYLLNITQNTISIFAETDAGLFYGMQSLKQLLNSVTSQSELPGLVLYDKPDFKIRAWQDDISRGPIPTMETLKKQIEIFSSYKLNYFTLYTEPLAIKLKKHPKIAPEDAISEEDLIELGKFAEEHFVTLIGNYQSFGHMNKFLKLPYYKHLSDGDGDDIISPTLPETYQFFSEVFEEIVPNYNGKYFNINCDETFGLGEGKSKKMKDSIGVEGIYSYHINKLDGLLKKYDKKILMWGDIAVSFPKIIPQLPKDITVIAWAYDDSEKFDVHIKPLKDNGLNVWIAPGVSCWSNIFPNLEVAQNNIYNFIRDGYNYKAEGVLNTSWDDDGLNFFNQNWYAFIWGAEISWNAPKNVPKTESDAIRKQRLNTFNQAFDLQFYGLRNESIGNLMTEFSSQHLKKLRDALRNYRVFEPIFPIFIDYVQSGELEKNTQTITAYNKYLEQIKLLKNKVNDQKESLDYLLFSIEMAKYVCEKNIFRIHLNDFIENHSNSKSKVEIKQELAILKQNLVHLKGKYTHFWNLENRKYWLSENLTKFNELLNSYEKLTGEIIINATQEITDKGRKIEIRSVFGEYPIYYGLNSSDTNLTPYFKPFYIKNNSKIIASSKKDDQFISSKTEDVLHHLAVGRLLKLNTTYSNYLPSYDGGGKYGLIDGKTGSTDDLKSGLWQGYGKGNDIDVELDFTKVIDLQSFSMGFFQNTMSWVIFPPKVEIYLKNKENEAYVLIKTITNKILPEEKGALKDIYQTNLTGKKGRFMRIVAKNYGNLPDWHPAGSSYKGMIFADEIVVK